MAGATRPIAIVSLKAPRLPAGSFHAADVIRVCARTLPFLGEAATCC